MFLAAEVTWSIPFRMPLTSPRTIFPATSEALLNSELAPAEIELVIFPINPEICPGILPAPSVIPENAPSVRLSRSRLPSDLTWSLDAITESTSVVTNVLIRFVALSPTRGISSARPSMKFTTMSAPAEITPSMLSAMPCRIPSISCIPASTSSGTISRMASTRSNMS